MIYPEVTEGEFVDAVKEDFTAEQARALYDFLYELSEDIGEPMELDPAAIRGDFGGYDSIIDAAEEYDYEDAIQDILQNTVMDEDEKETELLDWFREHRWDQRF